jgi:hypothetical protein
MTHDAAVVFFFVFTVHVVSLLDWTALVCVNASQIVNATRWSREARTASWPA